jgi:GDPmannose 4,6-dehydratase
MRKIALICGVSGQDGTYLASLLLSKGYEVWGTSRDAQGSAFPGLQVMGIKDRVKLVSMVPEDFRSVLVAVKESQAEEVYYLAGQSSVGLSFEQPAETIQSAVMGILNVLEACRFLGGERKVYHAGSSECFGDTSGRAADEATPFSPKSPYGVAKSSAVWLVRNYREAYGLFACSGILFNHESPIRPARFVTQKIVAAAKRISAGAVEPLRLGRLDIRRDWGWAPEYVDAMWRMLQVEQPEDFVIATGVTHSLQDFVATAFEEVGLDWQEHVIEDPALYRPAEISDSRADVSMAAEKLGWKAERHMKDVVRLLLRGEAAAP